MNMPLRKFDTTTAYLYDCAFDLQLPAQDYEICVDCLSQPNPWQSLRHSQNQVDKLSAIVGLQQQQSNQICCSLKRRLLINKINVSQLTITTSTIVSDLTAG